MVEFGGWLMPVQYSTILDEHKAVRTGVGLFDISHMGRLVFDGSGSEDWLEQLTTNHVARLKPGRIQYSLMCTDDGGVLDDVLVYRMSDRSLRLVCNASNRLKVRDQFLRHATGRDAIIFDHTETTAMIAVQGPCAEATLSAICDLDLTTLNYYSVTEGRITSGPATGTHAVVSRTGYTGEDGFEVIVPSPLAIPTWESLLERGGEFNIRPCGLGARDTLRFEAAMPLYGHEMDETVDPYTAELGWAVKLDKGSFVGRDALRDLKTNHLRTRVGLALEGKRIARQGCPVLFEDEQVGVVTSGTYAPTLGQSLAMALVRRRNATIGTSLTVDVRGKPEPALVVPLPFYSRNRETLSTPGPTR
jgi:aminomethyltransferase